MMANIETLFLDYNLFWALQRLSRSC